MLKERIQINDPDAKPYAAAKMDGYKLDFNYRSTRWQGAVATVVESPESCVWGVVWIKHNSTIASLDEQEGVHLEIYKPIFVEVTTTEGEVLKCRCYQQITELEEDRRPSAVYKNVMVRGARENGVPEDYINNELITIIDNGYDGDVEVKLELEKRKLD